MKFCSNCGEKLPDNAKFCNKCGFEQKCNPVTSVNGKKYFLRKKNKVIPILLCVAILLLIVCIGILAQFIRIKGKEDETIQYTREEAPNPTLGISDNEQTIDQSSSVIEDEQLKDESPNVEENSQPESQKYDEHESGQPIYYEKEEMKEIGSEGNTYDFNEDYLGYYTNGYFALDLKQINGDVLIIDLFFYDYYFGTMEASIMSADSFNFEYLYGNLQGSTVVRDGAYNSQYNTADTNIVIKEDGSFSFDKSAQFENALYGCLGEGIGLFADLDVITNAGEYYNSIREFAFGTYFKSEQKYAYCLNAYNPALSDAGFEWAEECYYENTQPLKDRIAQEQFPKYIKYMPTSKFYINGNPELKEDFILAQVFTAEGTGYSIGSDEYNMDNKIKVRFTAFHYNEEQEFWMNSGNYGEKYNSSWRNSNEVQGKTILNDTDLGETTINFYNFNYEIPNMLGLSMGKVHDEKVLADGYKKADSEDSKGLIGINGILKDRHVTLDTSRVSDGIITVNTDYLQLQCNEPYDFRITYMVFDGTQEKTLQLQAIDEDVLLGYGLNLTEN